jgi:hypothetical protein
MRALAVWFIDLIGTGLSRLLDTVVRMSESRSRTERDRYLGEL